MKKTCTNIQWQGWAWMGGRPKVLLRKFMQPNQIGWGRGFMDSWSKNAWHSCLWEAQMQICTATGYEGQQRVCPAGGHSHIRQSIPTVFQSLSFDEPFRITRRATYMSWWSFWQNGSTRWLGTSLESPDLSYVQIQCNSLPDTPPRTCLLNLDSVNTTEGMNKRQTQAFCFKIPL